MKHNLADNLFLGSALGAIITLSNINQIVSILAGLAASGSGLMAIRYYYLKSKK